MSISLKDISTCEPPANSEVLEEAFRRERARRPYLHEDEIFCWVSVMGNHGEYRYGSYKRITPSILRGREYEIECSDSGVSIFFTDVVHDPLTYRNVPKEVQP